MRTRLTARGMLACYFSWMALLVTLHYALPRLRTEAAPLIDLTGAAAIVIGVLLNRPVRRAPWFMIAAANLTGALGLLTARVQRTVTGAPLPFPSFGDVVYLLEYPLFVAGLVLFIRARSAERDMRSVLDALTLTLGLGLLAWLFLLVPDATNPALSWPQRFVSVAYPVGDLIILMMLARLLAPGTEAGPAALLITVGTIAGIGSDVAYDLIKNSGNQHGGTLLSLGWLVCYIAWGAAALHPSMTGLTQAAGRRLSEGATSGVALLVVASLIPPVFLFVHASRGRDGVEGVIAIACGVLYLLMLTRLWEVAASHRRSILRERTLRVASAALASAGSVEEVARAVRDAAATLVPGTPVDRAAVLAVREGDRLRRVRLGNPGRPAGEGDPLDLWLRLSDGPVPRFVTLDEITAARQDAGVSVPYYPPDAGYDGALICPLTLKDRPAGDPFLGVLIYYGDRRVLADRSPALEILAGQAALAVERVILTQEVVRQRGEALFRTLVQDASDVILILGDDRRIRYATPSAADIFGNVAVENSLLVNLVAPGTRGDVDRVLDLMFKLSAGGLSPGYLLQIQRLDGRAAVIEVRGSDLRDDENVDGLVLTLRDVTEQHQLAEELTYRAFHDALTGLPNRTLFGREAASALASARTSGRVAGVLFVDLDDFKIVNDTMGHGVGDELLAAVAVRLEATIRATDTAARLGGDEFALLIDDAADAEAVDTFAERIVAAFTEPFTLSESKVITSATVGVATSADSDDVDELLRHADLALYSAKSAGKRRWRHYDDSLTSGMMQRREVQAALEDAVKNSAFALVYQPIVVLDSGEIAGFEALLRWPRPGRRMVMPGEFIPVAEETGLIVPIGDWVLRRALSDMAHWRRGLSAAAPDKPGTWADSPHISVNVSARQFFDPGFVSGVRRALRLSGLPPSALLLEITESLLLGGNERIRADLAELKETGVRLAIDDFGTGYSSLAYLLDLPIDVLKIDKTFVTGIGSQQRRHALVEGIIKLSRPLQVEVIAEGIETETERELLAAMGCQFGQGYLLSVPVDAAAAEAMLVRGCGLVRELPQQRRRSPGGHYLRDL
jgi:diguanylate cyclase (GGDEF)-like protein/PAS domain S-box-containing protein